MQIPENPVFAPEAARRLGVPLYALHRLAQRGLLGPVVQIGGRYIFDAEAVAAYEAQRGKPDAKGHTRAASHAKKRGTRAAVATQTGTNSARSPRVRAVSEEV